MDLCTWVVKFLAWYLVPALLPLSSLLLNLFALWVKPHCNYMFLKSLENFTPAHAYLKPRINAATNPSPDILFRVFHFPEPLNPLLSLSQWQDNFQPLASGEATVGKRNRPFIKCWLMSDKMCRQLTDSGKERGIPTVREKASSMLGAMANCACCSLHNLECTMHLMTLTLSGL